jgi:hypothetical protein
MDETWIYTNCCECGVRIYMERDFKNTLINTHHAFCCINGHSQSFVGESDADKLKKVQTALLDKNLEINALNHKIEEKERLIAKLPNCYCTKCKLTLASPYSLKRHNKSKHSGDINGKT